MLSFRTSVLQGREHVSIKPVNYFATDEDANSYTGGRLSAYLCKHCGTKGSPEHAK